MSGEVESQAARSRGSAEDPIVTEVRRVRAALDHELGYDVDALFRDIQARTERGEFADFQIVRRPPRLAQPQAALLRDFGDDG